jgi:hypothetical protein
MGGYLLLPAYDFYVWEHFGHVTNNRAHAGMDFDREDGVDTAGEKVYASSDGKVVCVQNATFPGYAVVLEHTLSTGGTVYTMYGHLSSPSVSVGQNVSASQQIGTVYNQGSSSNLHFEVRTFKKWSSSDCAGPGYALVGHTPEQDGYLDPVEWVFEHRPRFAAYVISDDRVNVHAEPSFYSTVVGSLPGGIRVVANGIHEDESSKNYWWYKVQYGPGEWGYAEGYSEGSYAAGDISVTEYDRDCDALGLCRQWDYPYEPYCTADPYCSFYWCSYSCHPTGTTLCDAGCGGC